MWPSIADPICGSGARPAPVGVVIGAAVGGTLALLVSLAGLYICLRWRRRRDCCPQRGERDPRGIDEPTVLNQLRLGYASGPFVSPGLTVPPAAQQQSRRVKEASPLGGTPAGSAALRRTQLAETKLAGSSELSDRGPPLALSPTSDGPSVARTESLEGFPRETSRVNSR